MTGPFKMKGFSGFGNSPAKHTISWRKQEPHTHNGKSKKKEEKESETFWGPNLTVVDKEGTTVKKLTKEDLNIK